MQNNYYFCSQSFAKLQIYINVFWFRVIISIVRRDLGGPVLLFAARKTRKIYLTIARCDSVRRETASTRARLLIFCRP